MSQFKAIKGDFIMSNHKIARFFLLTLFSLCLSIPLSYSSDSGVYKHTIGIDVPEPSIEEGIIAIENYSTCSIPGNPALPQNGVNFVVHPDIDWDTLAVSVTEEKSSTLYVIQPIKPVPPAILDIFENDIHIKEEYFGENRDIVDGMDMEIYGANRFYPDSPVKILPYSQIRKWNIARILFYPVRYNPVTGELLIIRNAKISISYSLKDTRLFLDEKAALFKDSVADARVADITVNFDEMKSFYENQEFATVKEGNESEPLSTTYNYIIITTNYIRSNSTKLNNYVAHKQAQFYTVLVKTVEEIEAEYTRALKPHLFETTDDRADRIRAFLKDKYIAYGTQWLMLIGNPTPGTGDVPMKYCDPDQYDAPTDSYYSDLTGRWDLDGDTLYGEHPDDAGTGGVDFAGPELYVCRIPNYSTNLTSLDSILQKIITYENDMANESWRKSCLMPNPIDSSDSYGQEGNLSPVTMVEYIKNNALIPAGFSYYRILEHKYNWYPINVTPDPEKTPANPGYTNITYYDSTRRFFAALNTTSSDVSAYTIGEMTDNNNSTYYETTNMQPNHWLQFKQTNSNLLNANYNPNRVIIRSTNKAYLPQKFIIQMASDGSFSDAYTIITETDANAHAVADGSYWKLQYDYPASMNCVSYRRYFRLKYTGESAQATVRINEFQVYTEQHLSIKPYVIPEWKNGYGICYYNTHGSATTAADVIDYTECSQLDNNKPSFVFSKACQNAWPENSNNLCYSLLKNGAIADLAATRTSYGLGDAGYPKLFPRLCGQNKRFGQTLAEMYSQMAINGELGWGGLFADCMRFNIYGDPTVALRADAELDGMPYWWELHYGLNPAVNDADGDLDNDGFTNYEEYINGTDPTVSDNNPPDTPTLISPDDGALGVGMTPTLVASAFSDPDGDTHQNTRWQVDNNSDFSSPEWDSGDSYQASTQTTVSPGVLIDGINYWRVRYKDHHGSWSGWSDYRSFNTHIATTIYIDDETDPLEDGSFEHPFDSFQEAINVAFDGDTIIVLDGTYKGSGNKNIDFKGKAITIKSQKGARKTVIDCENSGRGFIFFRGETPSSVLDGFTITNANFNEDGGAIYCENSSATIQNCILTGNSSLGGGAMECYNSQNLKMINCLIAENYGAYLGGGLVIGESTATLSNCTIVNNQTDNYGIGGGIYNYESVINLINCIVWDNTPDEIYDDSSIPVEAIYSDIKGGSTFPGVGNINSDPEFASESIYSYYLSHSDLQGVQSPCVNTGSDSAANLGLDQMTTRTDQGYDAGVVDMGFHYPPEIPVKITSITTNGNDITIEWNAQPAVSYTVQWSTDMLLWHDVPVGETGTWTDTNASGFIFKLYRVVE